MKQFTVYFEIFGKKMKTTVFANTEEEAKRKVKDKIVFHKVVTIPQDPFDFLMNTFGLK